MQGDGAQRSHIEAVLLTLYTKGQTETAPVVEYMDLSYVTGCLLVSTKRRIDANPELQVEGPVDDDPVITIGPDIVQLIDWSKEIS